ncbi:FIT family protein CG10671, partial [Aphis craccivora]
TTISDQSSTYSELAQTSITSSQSIGLQSVQTSINLNKEKLKNIQVICLTTDAWASLNNQSFITHNAHYMDDNTKLEYESLSCQVQGISIRKDNQELVMNTQYSELAGSETIWKDFDKSE